MKAFETDILIEKDYYPFGMLMVGRNWSVTNENYKFGFNGQEQDDEVYGNAQLNTAEFWQYDARLGRRWNLDPKSVPSIAGYAAFSNNPILFKDVLGDTVKYGSIIDRLVVGVNSIFNKNFRNRIQTEKASLDVYTYSMRNREPTLKNSTPQMNAVDDDYGSLFLGYDVRYSLGISLPSISIGIDYLEIGKDNTELKTKNYKHNFGKNQVDYTEKVRLNRRVNGSQISIDAENIPDQITLNDQVGIIAGPIWLGNRDGAEFSIVQATSLVISPVSNGKIVATIYSQRAPIRLDNRNIPTSETFGNITYLKYKGIHFRLFYPVIKFK